MRDDASMLADSKWWSTLTQHPLVELIKSNSLLLVAAGVALLALSVVSQRRVTLFIPLAALILLANVGYAGYRSSFESPDLGIKIFTGALFYLTIILACTNIAYRSGPGTFLNVICDSFFFISSAVIFINIFNILTGNGFVTGNPRLFGTTSHPNFLGVQLAIFSIINVMTFFRCSGKMRWLAAGVFACGFGLLVLTGSRTGLLIFVTGVFFSYWARSRFSIQTWLLSAVLAMVFAAVVVLLIYGNDSSGAAADPFARQGAQFDTRSGAWGYLWDRIVEDPIWGMGTFGLASENSFLRGWAAFGVLYLVMFSSVALISFFRLRVTCRELGFGSEVCYLFGLFVAILFGSVLEGYLTEVLGVPILFWIILTVTSGLSVYVRQQQTSLRGRQPRPNRNEIPTPSLPIR